MGERCNWSKRRRRIVTDVATIAVDRKLALAVFPLLITDTGSIPAQNPGNISFVKFNESPNVISNRCVFVLVYFQIRGKRVCRLVDYTSYHFNENSRKRACLGQSATSLTWKYTTARSGGQRQQDIDCAYTLRQKGLTVHRGDKAEEQRKGKRGK